MYKIYKMSKDKKGKLYLVNKSAFKNVLTIRQFRGNLIVKSYT